MNTASDKYGSSLDRTLGAGKPVDPATRLSELLAQSLEELTRPFDPPRPGAVPVKATGEAAESAPPVDAATPAGETHGELAGEAAPERDRADADKALAELEAELFAAAKQGIREGSDPPAEASAEHDEKPADQPMAVHDGAQQAGEGAPNEADIVQPPPLAPEEPPAPDGDAARVIAKVRKLMLVSMAVTVIAVGSVFGFIGYRIFKGDGTTAKTADKLPEASAIPADVTLAIPRGARVIQSAVASDRLVMTLEIDGKIEVRTFDVKTLQPAGRINFSAAP
jgi:hypothetical protein